jgi:uncharacterized damage-inducible protein DinB
MRSTRLTAPLSVVAASLLLAAPVSAQQAASDAGQQPSIVTDLLTDIDQARSKLVQLAEAIPEGSWGWRPGEGVRSVGEVFLHVTADNYLLPAALGTPAPESTGIDGEDYATVQAFEARSLDKAQTIAEMQASFDHLVEAIGRTDERGLAQEVRIFGGEWSGQGFLVLTATHLHEHLGQMIAYARTNGVVPPWSGGQ